MRKRSTNFFAAGLAGAVGAGLALRLVYALAVMGNRPVTGDGREFHLLANVLASDGRYLQPFRFLFQHGTAIPTAEKPPLYPLVLALPSWLGLDGYTAHRVATCIIGATAIALIGLLARRVAGPRVGVVAAALAAFYPALWMLDASLRSESLYVPLIAAALLAAYRLRDGAGNAALLGAAIGLAALTRSEAILLLVVLVAPLVALLPRGRRRAAAAAALAGCALVVAPWLARNWVTFGRPTAISTNEGGLLAGANTPATYHGPLIGSWTLPTADPAWGTNEAVIAGHLRARALGYASDHAGRVPAVVGVRVLRVWDLWKPRQAAHLESFIADRDLHVQQAAVVVLYLLAPLAIAGAVVLRRRGEPLRILLAPIVLVTLVGATTYGSTRFRAAAEVPIVVLAATGATAAWERRSAWARRRSLAGSR